MVSDFMTSIMASITDEEYSHAMQGSKQSRNRVCTIRKSASSDG